MLLECFKSLFLIVLGFVLYHVVKNNLLQKPKKAATQNREKAKEILLEIEKKKVELTPKEKRKMRQELTEYFSSINSQGSQQGIAPDAFPKFLPID